MLVTPHRQRQNSFPIGISGILFISHWNLLCICFMCGQEYCVYRVPTPFVSQFSLQTAPNSNPPRLPDLLEILHQSRLPSLPTKICFLSPVLTKRLLHDFEIESCQVVGNVREQESYSTYALHKKLTTPFYFYTTHEVLYCTRRYYNTRILSLTSRANLHYPMICPQESQRGHPL